MNLGLFVIFVVCKCEYFEDDWEVDVEGMVNYKFFKVCIVIYQIIKDNNEMVRVCLQVILKVVIVNRRGQYSQGFEVGK